MVKPILSRYLWISLSSLEAAKLLRLDISTGTWKTAALGATRPLSISLTRHTCLQKSFGRSQRAHIRTPKSGKGRQIRLCRSALEALKSHCKRQLEERMRLAGVWKEHGLVFPSQVGTPLWARNLNHSYKRLLRRGGLPTDFRFQDLRHTCATLLLRQGVNPKFVQELLGHGDVSLTLNVYSHVLPSMGDQTATAMDKALG